MFFTVLKGTSSTSTDCNMVLFLNIKSNKALFIKSMTCLVLTFESFVTRHLNKTTCRLSYVIFYYLVGKLLSLWMKS